MSDGNLKQELEQLKKELREQKEREEKKRANDFIEGIIGLGFLIAIGIWLFNGGFGAIARFLDSMKFLQH